METETKSFIFSLRSYCICTSQGFITKCFLIFIVDEVTNFAVINIHLSYCSQSQIGDLCIKGKKATTRSSPIGYWSKDSTIGWYFEIGQDSGKIPYTCNYLIVDYQILRSDDLKITQQGFCLARSFSHLSTNHYVNLIFAAFNLIGDLLVFSRFAFSLT